MPHGWERHTTQLHVIPGLKPFLTEELVAGRHRMSSCSSPDANNGPEGIQAMAFTGWVWS